jgi:RNA polymerase sigma-70 factor (ECF subfamily)
VAEFVITADVPIIASSDDVLESAVREHSRLVYRVAYSVLRNHHDAEDATQETFVRVMRYQRKLAAVENPRNWLARIALRVALDRRRKGREVPIEERGEPLELCSLMPEADEIARGNELSVLLETLMAALPEKLRYPLALSTLEEMTPEAISEVLEISPAAVRSRISRARQILRRKLRPYMEGKHAQ